MKGDENHARPPASQSAKSKTHFGPDRERTYTTPVQAGSGKLQRGRGNVSAHREQCITVR